MNNKNLNCKKNKNIHAKFHLKNLFDFIENDKFEFDKPEKNEIFVIYESSDDDLNINDKSIKSPIIGLIYPINSTKKRKRQK